MRIPLDDRTRRVLIGILLVIVALALFYTTWRYYPEGIDWVDYRSATLDMLSGRSPYIETPGYFTPPWTLVPLIPFALLSAGVGRSLWLVISLGMFAYIGYRMGGSPIGVLAFLLSAPVTNCLAMGNVEWLALLGLLIPPQYGLLLLAIKPQGTWAFMLYLVWEAWHEGGIMRVLHILWPVAALTLLSFALYGLWPLYALNAPDRVNDFVISLWPHSIPIGLVLLVKALRDHKRELSLFASPLLSPFGVLHSWSGALVALSPSTLEIVTASIGSWIFWAIYRTSLG